MDSNEDSEGVLVIDDQSSSDEVSVVVKEEPTFQGSLAKFSNGAGANSSNYSKVPDVVELLSCDDSSTPEKTPTSNWNHPKLKRKFEGDGCWGSAKKVKSENEASSNKDCTANGTKNQSPCNLLEEHTYARKLSSSDSGSLNKSMEECGNKVKDEKETLKKMQLNLSALCTVLYSLQSNRVVSISLDEFYNLTQSLHSSGNLTNNAASTHHSSGSGMSRLPSAAPSYSGSSSPTVSTSKKINVRTRQETLGFRDLGRTEECVCCRPCICDLVFGAKDINRVVSVKTGLNLKFSSNQFRTDPLVTSTSNSDDNLTTPPVKRIERRGRPRKLKRNPVKKIVKDVGVKQKRGRKAMVKMTSSPSTVVKDEVSSTIPAGVHQCPPDCKYGKDLLVFAKWPADKIYYPAIVKNCFYTDWEYSNNLSVQFFDGASILMSSCNIFPASLLVEGAFVTYKNTEDEYIDGTIKRVERTHPCGTKKAETCLSLTVECTDEEDDDFGKVLTVPYNLIALNDHCYKSLKKEIGEAVLTPHKFSRTTYNVCHDNLIEGKRKRRGVEEAVALILSEETSKRDLYRSGGSTSARRKRKQEVESDFEDIPTEKVKPFARKERCISTTPRGFKSRRGGFGRGGKRTPGFTLKSDGSSEGSLTKPKESGVKGGKRLDRHHLPGTSSMKRPVAVRELVFRKDVVSEEDISDSEPEDDLHEDFDISGVGGGDIDYECTTVARTIRKSCGNRVIKSSSKNIDKVLSDDESLVNRYGPIPKSALFAGYTFVLTHGGPNSYYKNKEHFPEPQSSDDEETQTFDHMRLRNQITAGKGQVVKHLLSVDKELMSKTVVISDFYCRTANYLLAAALNVPVYSHQLIIQCCIQDVPLEKMLERERPLLAGVSCDGMRHKFNKKRKVEAMKSYIVVLASTESNKRLRYWAKLIRVSGGKISYYTPDRNVFGGMLTLASVVIVDDYCTPELLDSAKKNNVPVVSTKWLVDTIVRGHKQIMLSTDLPHYKVDLIMSSQPTSVLSEAQ